MTLQQGFLFRIDRCTGCGACIVACSNENRSFTTETQRTQSAPQAEHRTSNIEHRTSNEEPQSAIRNPQFRASPDVRSPMSDDFNPQSAIRNPHLSEVPAPRSQVLSPFNVQRSAFDVRRSDPTGAVSPFRRFAISTPSADASFRNWRQVVTFNERRHPALPSFHLSLACNHCADPACLANCPANAYRKDPSTGAVTIDPSRCIGCKYCTWACPYDAPRFNEALGIMQKCIFCPERQAAGLEPACVANCPTGALSRASLDPGAEVPAAPGLTPTTIHPALRIEGGRAAGSPPELTSPADRAAVDAVFDRTFPRLPAKITLRAEWALVAFTATAATLVGWLGAALLAPVPLLPAVFLGAGGAAMLLSAVHLGRKERAWRAILHARRSWLSLEILLFSLFLGLAAAHLLIAPAIRALGWLAAVAGLAALFAIDRVYQVALQHGRLVWHSATALLTGLFLAGVLSGTAPLYLAAGLVKLGCYLARKVAALRGWNPDPAAGRNTPWVRTRTGAIATGLRLLLGFALPPVLVLLAPPDGPGSWSVTAAASVLLGEWIDRAEFYAELDVITPRRQMAGDLERAWRALRT